MVCCRYTMKNVMFQIYMCQDGSNEYYCRKTESLTGLDLIDQIIYSLRTVHSTIRQMAALDLFSKLLSICSSNYHICFCGRGNQSTWRKPTQTGREHTKRPKPVREMENSITPVQSTTQPFYNEEFLDCLSINVYSYVKRPTMDGS